MSKSISKLGLSGLVLGTAMGVPAAQAEPLTLTPVQMDTVTASGFGFAEFFAFVDAFKNFETTIDFTKTADVDVNVSVTGLLADAHT